MKRQLHALLALLFILSTIVTSLHELAPHHDSSNCQICTLVQHDNGLVPTAAIELETLSTLFDEIRFPDTFHSAQATSTLLARAPPLFS